MNDDVSFMDYSFSGINAIKTTDLIVFIFLTLFAHHVLRVVTTVIGFIQPEDLGLCHSLRGGMTPGDANRMWEGTTHCISSCHKQEGLLSLC